MMVTMLLADAAQTRDGKLYILGGGWSVTGPEPEPSALALLIKVPWDQANERHQLRLELVDSDGHPVSFETPVGEQDLTVESEFEVGRPPGTTRGTPLDMQMVFQIRPNTAPAWRALSMATDHRRRGGGRLAPRLQHAAHRTASAGHAQLSAYRGAPRGSLARRTR